MVAGTPGVVFEWEGVAQVSELKVAAVALEPQEEVCTMGVVLLVGVVEDGEVRLQEVAEVDMMEVVLLPEALVEAGMAAAHLEPVRPMAHKRLKGYKLLGAGIFLGQVAVLGPV